MGEKMTLKQAVHHLEGCDHFMNGVEWDALQIIKRHLATPAQTVDIEAVREVRDALDCYWDESQPYDHLALADKLSQAIGDKNVSMQHDFDASTPRQSGA